MSAGNLFFLDSNVLIYGFDSRDMLKQQSARDWVSAVWGAGTGRLSWQVLHEFCVNATKAGVPAPIAREAVRAFVEWGPVDSNALLVARAWHWMDSAHIGYWDALIVAAAEISDCRYVLSEDLQDRRVFESTRVVNPFRAQPAEFGLARPA